jgi:hypothetical protein
MIKEKHLVPGRVLLRLSEKRVARFDKEGRHLKDDWVDTWRPCMVIAYYPDISRRHAKKTAPVNGYEVLVIWFGGDTQTSRARSNPPRTQRVEARTVVKSNGTRV